MIPSAYILGEILCWQHETAQQSTTHLCFLPELQETKTDPNYFQVTRKHFFLIKILNQVNLFNLKVEKTTKSTLYIQRHFFLDEYHNMKVHQAPASYTQPKIPQYKPTVTEVMSASKFKNIPKES